MCRISNPTQHPALRTSLRTDVLLLFLGGVFFVFLGDGEGRDFLTFELTFGPNPHQTHIRLTSDSRQTHSFFGNVKKWSWRGGKILTFWILGVVLRWVRICDYMGLFKLFLNNSKIMCIFAA